jgi:hypothetical protein
MENYFSAMIWAAMVTASTEAASGPVVLVTVTVPSGSVTVVVVVTQEVMDQAMQASAKRVTRWRGFMGGLSLLVFSVQFSGKRKRGRPVVMG